MKKINLQIKQKISLQTFLINFKKTNNLNKKAGLAPLEINGQ